MMKTKREREKRRKRKRMKARKWLLRTLDSLCAVLQLVTTTKATTTY